MIGGFGVRAAAYLAGVWGKTADVLARMIAGSARFGADGIRTAARRRAQALFALGASVRKRDLPGRFAPFLIALLFCTFIFASFGIVGNAAEAILRAQGVRRDGLRLVDLVHALLQVHDARGLEDEADQQDGKQFDHYYFGEFG